MVHVSRVIGLRKSPKKISVLGSQCFKIEHDVIVSRDASSDGNNTYRRTFVRRPTGLDGSLKSSRLEYGIMMLYMLNYGFKANTATYIQLHNLPHPLHSIELGEGKLISQP